MKNFNLYRPLLSIGPGIFAIGYTIGTGSVTPMIVAGSKYGMQLLWVLFLSCLFSWGLMEAYERYAQVLSQVFNVFVLPLVIFGIFLMVNKKSLMVKEKAGNMLNMGIVFAFIFSILISSNGVICIINNF